VIHLHIGPWPGLNLQATPRSHKEATVSIGGRRDRGDFAPFPPSSVIVELLGQPVRGGAEHVAGDDTRTLLVVAGSTLYRIDEAGTATAVTGADGGPLVIGGAGPVQMVADQERVYILAPA